jgi:hypothetical protein
MKRGTVTHRKVRRLASLLGIPRLHAAGLWGATLEYVAEHAPSGDVTDHLDAIAAACDWPDEATLVEALVSARNIDVLEDGRHLIHGWSEHAEDSVHTRLACKGEWFADGTKPSVKRLNSEQRDRANQKLGDAPPPSLHNVAQRCVAYDKKAHVPSPSPSPSPSPPPSPSLYRDAAHPSAPTPAERGRSRSVDPLRWTPELGWDGISDADRAAWSVAYPAVDQERQLAAADQWLRANPAKAKKSLWRKFLSNWLSRQQERGTDIPASRPAKQSHDVLAQLARIEAEEATR